MATNWLQLSWKYVTLHHQNHNIMSQFFLRTNKKWADHIDPEENREKGRSAYLR